MIARWSRRRFVLPLTLVATVALGGALAGMLSGADAQARVRWKMQSTFPGTMVTLGTSGKYFSDQVKLTSGGRIDIQFFDPGKLVPALQVFDAVRTGGVDAGWSAAGYWIGKIPAGALFTAVPFGPGIGEYLAWIYEGNGLKLWQELYAKHGLTTLPCAVISPEASGWFRKEIKSIDDFKGLKIRFFGLGGKVMEKLGASVQLLAGGDIYPALERGVLDATEFSMPSIDEGLGFHRVAKYYYFPGWHQQTTILELLMSTAKWEALSAVDKAAIDHACKTTMVKTIAEAESMQGPALARMKERGVQIRQWSPEILDALRKTWREVVAEERKDPDFNRVWEDYAKFRAEYAEWRKLGHLTE
jgi:TRAP-type mannitol/chloroaromatic compound transport system substrate-binding protein